MMLLKIFVLFLLFIVMSVNGEKDWKKETWKKAKKREKNNVKKHQNTTFDPWQTSARLPWISGNQCIYMVLDIDNDSKFIQEKEHHHNPSKLCKKVFDLRILDTEPYSGTEPTIFIKDVLEECCRSFKSTVTVTKEISLKSTLHHNPDIIFPVFAYSHSRIVYGYFFVPLLDPTGAFYVTREQTHGIFDMLEIASTDILPILVMTISMAVLAGLLVWLVETRSNKEQFQRSFIKGWADGIWWSFVSMTTVGYGDKSPKSFVGRILSILWILIGIASFSIISGKLTTVILQASTSKEYHIEGESVGILRNRLYDRGLVTRNGGIANVSGNASELDQVCELISRLKCNEIDGILFDKYTYRSMIHDIQNMSSTSCKERKSLADFFLQRTTTTNIPDSGEDVSYGVLIRDKQHYEYLKPVIEGNKLFMQTRLSTHRKKQEKRTTSIEGLIRSFRSKDLLLKHLKESQVSVVVVAIVCIFFLGLLGEYCWNRRCVYNISDEESTTLMTTDGRKELKSSF